MRQTHTRNPQPYWHCGQETVKVTGDHDPGGVYSGAPMALECPNCGARADWVLTHLPPPGTMGSPDYGWGPWRDPRPAH